MGSSWINSSPFYKSARAIEVKHIAQTSFEPFLESKFKRGQRTVQADVWNAVFRLEITGDIQQLCSALWQSSEAGSEIDLHTLNLAYDRIFCQEIEGFRLTLGALTALQLRVLKAIAHTGTNNLYSLESQQTIQASSSSIRRSVGSLIDKWILVKDHEIIYFNNSFLRLFIQEKRI